MKAGVPGQPTMDARGFVRAVVVQDQMHVKFLEVQGKPSATLKAGEAFTTAAGEVHNVKNASTTVPAKALAFYIAKKGARLEDLAVPAK